LGIFLAEQVALVMHSNYRGALVKRWLGFVDSDDNVLDEGYLLGTWNVDTMSISTGKKATIVGSLNASLALLALEVFHSL
jgi:hypothetical protein